MKTAIEIDVELLEEAVRAAGLESGQATVEAALRRLVLEHRRRAALAALGGVGWEGDLDQLRRDVRDQGP